MLHIQSYLRAFEHRGPEQLKEELGIEYRRKGGKVLFNYNQYDSPKTHPIVKESRGLILYDGSWDVACFPFERFFNYGEAGAEVIQDLANAMVFPKLDGTMCNVYFDKNDGLFHISTRSMIDGEGSVGDLNLNQGTFAELFREGFLKTKLQDMQKLPSVCRYLTLTFELTSPLNRIVTPYKETSVTLLNMRDIRDNRELSNQEIHRHADDIGCGVISPVNMRDWKQLLAMFPTLPDTDEGYVVCKESREGSHKRLKVKNPAYLTIAHLVEHPSEKHFMQILQRGSADEVLVHYPEYKGHFDKLQMGLDLLSNKLRDEYLSIHEIKDRKDFAIEATKKMFPGQMFAMRDKRTTCLASDLLLMDTKDLIQMIHRVLSEVK